jgi:DNA-binding transcriptional regulator YhcF (GntR family)
MLADLELAVDRRSGVPLAAQLATRVRDAIRAGGLAPGDRLPSVRALAETAGVNVNTIRAVYARLESEGLVRSQQGRGTFVADARGDDAATRRELRRQIAALEAELVRLPPPPVLASERRPRAAREAALLSTEALESVRDDLVTRLRELDAERSAVLARLDQLGGEQPVTQGDSRRASPSLAGVRVRWVGA